MDSPPERSMNLRFVMPSRNDSLMQSPKTLEQQIFAIILSLHLQLESLEATVEELRRRQQEAAGSGKQGG
jgi:hypothetical protein